MKQDQYFLCKIAEECNEVAQRALKAQQFGLGEIQQGQNLNNLERLVQEFYDLSVTFEEMISRIDAKINITPSEFVREKRLEKMRKFLELSKSLNQVDEDATI